MAALNQLDELQRRDVRLRRVVENLQQGGCNECLADTAADTLAARPAFSVSPRFDLASQLPAWMAKRACARLSMLLDQSLHLLPALALLTRRPLT
jgi:hypothetical protein